MKKKSNEIKKSDHKEPDSIAVKILKLNSNVDVIGICNFYNDEPFINLVHPMIIHINRNVEEGRVGFVFIPWLPIEFIEYNNALVYYSDIVSIVNPRNSFIDEYFETVHKVVDLMNEIEEDDIEEINDDEEDKNFQEVTKETNKKLH